MAEIQYQRIVVEYVCWSIVGMVFTLRQTNNQWTINKPRCTHQKFSFKSDRFTGTYSVHIPACCGSILPYTISGNPHFILFHPLDLSFISSIEPLYEICSIQLLWLSTGWTRSEKRCPGVVTTSSSPGCVWPTALSAVKGDVWPGKNGRGTYRRKWSSLGTKRGWLLKQKNTHTSPWYTMSD